MEVRVKIGSTDMGPPTVHSGERWDPIRHTQFYRRGLKRALDAAVVLLALPIILPTILCLAAVIFARGQAPFYRQARVGRGGKIFSMWKLRTMVADSEQRLQEYLAQDERARSEWDAFQKLKDDPRITPIGHILRKTSLDELPQLWNVLIGDMSLVGPRPMMPSQKSLYPGHAYYALRPGVTGFWQVSDRNTSTFAQRAEFDTAYERSLSFATDVRVLAATVGVVFRCTGR